MLELPEAVVIAGQINAAMKGKQIQLVIANQSPHKFAWFTGDPDAYPELLQGRMIGQANAFGGIVEFFADDLVLSISTNMRFYEKEEKRPPKHQLLLEFTDGCAFCATVQMWGGLFCFKEDERGGIIDTIVAIERPSPLTDNFDRRYFDGLMNENTLKMPVKAFLATEQRIPGLGNGVLQDILWTAKIHSRRKMVTLNAEEKDALFRAVKSVLWKMVECGGRDTENDLFGRPGGYKTVLSKNTTGTPCPVCSTTILKEAYMGGSIYFCPRCQRT
jgi:formamidopyrimidine-DNA glycosylase